MATKPIDTTAPADLVAELEAAGKTTTVSVGGEQVTAPVANPSMPEAGQEIAMAPGLFRQRKHDRYPAGIIKNPGVLLKDLPTKAEITDPMTGRVAKGVRYKKVKINSDGKKFTNEIVEF